MIQIIGSLLWCAFVWVTWRLSPNVNKPFLARLAWFNFGICFVVFVLGMEKLALDHPKWVSALAKIALIVVIVAPIFYFGYRVAMILGG